MSSLNLHHDFGNLAEEDWQEFAFSSVKDVHKLVRKTSEGYTLKPLYTQNDTLEHSKLLKGLSYKKNKVLAPISSQKDYDQASELGVSHFQVGLRIEQLEVEEMPSLGREDQSFFISLHQNPIVEATYWKKRIAKYQKRYFLFDPVTHILKQQKITRSFDLLVDDMFEFSKTFKESFIVSVDGHYLKSLGLSDVSELSHILLVFKYYLEEARKTFAFAKTAADGIEDSCEKAEAYKEVAIAQAKSGDFNGARETAAMIGEPFQKFLAYMNIAKYI